MLSLLWVPFLHAIHRSILLKGDRILLNLFRKLWLHFIQNRIHFRNLTWLYIIMSYSCTLRMPTPVASIPPPPTKHRFSSYLPHPTVSFKFQKHCTSWYLCNNTAYIGSFTFTIKLVRPSLNHNILLLHLFFLALLSLDLWK